MDNNYNNTEQLNNDMAILVVSYDGYCDMWDDFFNLLNMNWSDRTYPAYLANNVKEANYEGVKIINCGKDAQWSTRTRIALNQIKEPYICLLLEDYFIRDKVNNKDVQNAIDLMKKDSLFYYKLNSFSKINTIKYNESDYLRVIPYNLEYGISLQAAIWKKDFLLKLIGDEDYTAWKFEYERIEDIKNNRENVSSKLVYDSRNILNIVHGVAKGKFLPPMISYFKNKGYSLNVTDRPIMTKYEYMMFVIKRFLSIRTPYSVKSKIKRVKNSKL